MNFDCAIPSVRLGDVCEKVGSGATPRGGGEVYLPSGVALIRSQNVHNDRFQIDGLAYISDEHAEELANVTVRANDVLLNITGDSVARCCLAPEYILPARVNQHVSIIRPYPHRLDARYLRYYLVSPTIQQYMLALAGAGATRNALTKAMIEDFRIPARLLPEQRAIAHILGTLDDKIELNRKMNETLEAMAQALFKSWFVDFEPFRDQGMEESPLGPIPKGWRVVELSTIADTIDCLHSKKPSRQVSGKPLLQLWNIRDDGLIDMTDTYWITDQDYRTWTSRIEAQTSDCVITNVGRVAATAQIPQGLRVALGRNMTAIRCRKTFLFPTFLIECLRSPAMKDEIKLKIDTGTILDALNVRNIPMLRLVQPPLPLAEQFEARCHPIRAMMERNIAQNSTLASIRNALLPRLLSGEIRVKDAERFVERAA